MTGAHGRVPVWDAAVRICHWALAAIVAFELWRDDGDYVHRGAGYVAVGVVLARLAWAAVHRTHRLRPSLATTRAYVMLLRQGQPPRSAGHDPLGLWMVWLLWSLVLLLGLTGWMSRLDMFWGDERVQLVHAWLADALLVAACIHVAAVVLMSWLWRENLPAAMVTGRKRPVEAAGDEGRQR
jgi:cytochrome b